MRVRRLQYNEEGVGWYDDAYAYENEHGQVIFCYNLTWEKIGGRFGQQMREQQTSLEAVETVIRPTDRLRWLPIEDIPDAETEAFLAVLNEACAIPSPRSIKDSLAALVTG